MKQVKKYLLLIIVFLSITLLKKSVVYANGDADTNASSGSQYFNNVEAMKIADLKEGALVYTRGFYKANDGGACKYKITKIAQSKDNLISFKLDNGLYANVYVTDNTLCADQLGAHGDGVTDDAPYIQSALDSGYKATLGENKNYKLISNGLAIRRKLRFDGRNSHLIVDDSYSPTNKDFNRFVLRCGYNTSLESLNMCNFYLDINITEKRYTGGSSYLCAFNPKYIKSIILNNIHININSVDNKITAFWMENGCDRLEVTDSSFVNNSTGDEGGVVFFNSQDDPVFNYFTAFRNIIFTNCDIEGTCGDEALAIWGPNNVSAKFYSCHIDWRKANSNKSSRAIAIYCVEDKDVAYNIKFQGCSMITDSPYADSAIGIGSYYSPCINVNFSECEFLANIKNDFLFFQLLPRRADNITAFDYTKDRYGITFTRCMIRCNKTITGSQKWYDGESNANWAMDCTFNECEVYCNYCFVFLERYPSTQYYYVPKIKINGCNVTIDNAIGFIFKSNLTAEAKITVTNTNVYSPNLNSLVSYKYKTNKGAGITQSNVSSVQTSISGSTLNDARCYN